MTEWARFVLIVGLAAADHVWYETVLSFNTTRDFVRYRLRWIVRDKLRALVGGRR